MAGGGAPGPALGVAIVCPYSLSRPGGVQGQVLALARSLGGRGHRVTVFAPLDAAADAPDGIAVVPTGHAVSLRANGSVAPVTISLRAVRRAVGALRSLDADVVHVHEPFAPGLPYGVLAASGMPPVVATFHRSGHSVLYTLLRPLARAGARRLAARCAVSEAAAATASRALPGRYEVLFNGVEVDRYRRVEPWPTAGPTVLFLGRHEERKGLHVLLEAAECLARGRGHLRATDAPAPIFWIAGDGPETAALRRRHPESGTLKWLGVLTEEDKIRRLAAADVLTAPSLRGESFGMVLLEAMAARTVVVASDIEGYRAASGGCAVLVPPGDAGALAAAVAGVLDGSLAPPARAGAGEGPPTDRGAWLDRGLRARRAVVDGGAVRALRGDLPCRDGRGRALSGRTLLGP